MACCAIADDSLDFSFSGLKTAVINHIHNEKQKRKTDALPDEVRAEIAAAFTSSVCDGICKKLTSAIRSTGTNTVVMAGGVAANSHLRRAVNEVCQKNKAQFIVPALSLCGDNAAMVGAYAYHMYNLGLFADSSLNAYASDESAEIYKNKLINIHVSK